MKGKLSCEGLNKTEVDLLEIRCKSFKDPRSQTPTGIWAGIKHLLSTSSSKSHRPGLNTLNLPQIEFLATHHWGIFSCHERPATFTEFSCVSHLGCSLNQDLIVTRRHNFQKTRFHLQLGVFNRNDRYLLSPVPTERLHLRLRKRRCFYGFLVFLLYYAH